MAKLDHMKSCQEAQLSGEVPRQTRPWDEGEELEQAQAFWLEEEVLF